MAPLTAGSRSHVVRSSDGGVAHRWGRIHSAPRQPQAQRTVAKPLLKHRAQDATAFQHLCRPGLACAADAPPALAPCAQGWQATCVVQSPVRPLPRSAQRGRPSHGTPPDPGVSQLDGALAMRSAARQTRIDHHRCCILATHARDDPLFPPQEL